MHYEGGGLFDLKEHMLCRVVINMRKCALMALLTTDL